MPQRTDRDEREPAAACWFCEHRFSGAELQRDGILRSRRADLGGPYHLYVCPACSRENLCEKTPRGRWFSSPNSRFSFFDYLFSQVLDTNAEDVLAAISWFRDNEDRRRYFFERDGDRRYSGRSFLLRLWPGARGDGTAAEAARSHARADERHRREAGRAWQEARRAGGERRGRSGSGARPSESRESGESSRHGRGIVSPYEILGVEPDASEREIRAAFHRLAIHYHPDKVHHLGEEFQRVAHEKFTRLKAAYESLVARRARP